MKSPRPYRMQRRAAAAVDTGRRIIAATQALFVERPFEEMTLQAVAERAGVTLQTVLRRFGSKPELVAAAAAEAMARIGAQRGAAPEGDIRGAVQNLFDHYEQWADASLKMLAEEARFEEVAKLARDGRGLHVAWVEQTFAGLLKARRGRARTELKNQLVAVCDVYVWKVLRRDHGLTRADAEKAVLGIIEALATGGRTR